jgi:superfamily II DNA or RNA helicase
MAATIAVPNAVALKLWPHQVQAIKVVKTYLSSGSKGSALVRMPTGSGKTGVIACLAQYLSGSGCVVVVAPWKQLVTQTVDEVATAFWAKVGVSAPSLRACARLTPAEAPSLSKTTKFENTVFVTTFAGLQQLATKAPATYKKLASKCDLALVDEGHREPAPRWAEAVRALRAPTVLFTATPYRNDHLAFQIEDDHIFRLTLTEATTDRFLRRVEFDERDDISESTRFVKALVARVDAMATTPTARVIVRCESEADIRELKQGFKKVGRTAVAIHENFKTDASTGDFNSVPPPKTRAEQFWVHQNKLIEGIDDPAFRVVAFYGRISNERGFVQQVGRVLRNPQRHHGQTALVFGHAKDRLEETWKRFIQYEKRLEDPNAAEVGAAEIVERVMEATARLNYLDGQFRGPANPKDAKAYESLAFRRSIGLFVTKAGFNLDGLIEACRRELPKADAIQLGDYHPQATVRVLTHAQCAPTRLLRGSTFLDMRFGYTFARVVGKRLFYYDTNGLVPRYLGRYAERAGVAELESLLGNGNTQLTAVSLLNLDLGMYSVRRRAMSARSVEATAPALSDHFHFCSTAAGITDSTSGRVRRYVGLSRGRVSDQFAEGIPLDEFISWQDEIVANIGANPHPVFGRFAVREASPSDPSPTNVLLDLEDALEDFQVPIGSETVPLGKAVEDRCWDVEATGKLTGKFTVELIDGSSIDATIAYEKHRRRYRIHSTDLQQIALEAAVAGRRRRTLTSFLNHEQAFRVITGDGSVYARGNYYRPRQPLWGASSGADPIALESVLHEDSRLLTIKSEKGGAATGTSWANDSLFGYIDDATGLLKNEKIDLLVCDDLGNELADFIVVTKTPAVILIHAKHPKKSTKVSASAFHDVCGQATKNLGLLAPQSGDPPKNVAIWGMPWTHKDHGTVSARLRRGGPLPPAKIWERLGGLLRDPSVSREVWILMGDGLSRKAFQLEKKKAKPSPRAVQFFYLLQSTWSSVSAVGAKLKVICRP